MKHIKTATGFECDVDENVMNDMEVVDALADLQSGKNPMAYSVFTRKILGKNKEALYEHLRTDDGRVPMDAIGNEIADIITSLNEKN